MSPTIDPSSFSGLTKKGTALDISSAFKETDPTRWDCCNKEGSGKVSTERLTKDPSTKESFVHVAERLKAFPDRNQFSARSIGVANWSSS
jgi:hypothetical protein